MSECKTPRTDEFARIPSEEQTVRGIGADWAEFARGLERELRAAEADAAVKAFSESVDLSEAMNVLDDIGAPWGTSLLDRLRSLKDQLESEGMASEADAAKLAVFQGANEGLRRQLTEAWGVASWWHKLGEDMVGKHFLSSADLLPLAEAKWRASTDYAGSLQRAASALRKASGELIYGVAKALDISHFACRAERDAVLTALHEIDAVLAKNPVNAEPSASTQSAGTMESALNPGPHSGAATSLLKRAYEQMAAGVNTPGSEELAREIRLALEAEDRWNDGTPNPVLEIVRPNGDALALLHEWLDTELDPEDEEYGPWMESFTARVEAVLAGGVLADGNVLTFSEPVDSSGGPIGADVAARQARLAVGTVVRPFGWWDHFNAYLYRDERDAFCARTGGNKLTPLYEHPPVLSQVRAQEGPIELAIWASDDGVEDNTEFVAQVSGPREMAMAEARRYAAPYVQDGDRVVIEEVTRREVEVIPSRRTAQVRAEEPKA